MRPLGLGEPLQFREDLLLAAAVERERPVPTLANALVARARGDPAHLVEEAALRPHHAAAEPEPIAVEGHGLSLRDGRGAPGRGASFSECPLSRIEVPCRQPRRSVGRSSTARAHC